MRRWRVWMWMAVAGLGCGFSVSRAADSLWRCGVEDRATGTLQSWARRRAQPAALPASGSPRILLVRVDFSDLAGSPLSDAAAAGLVEGAAGILSDMSVGRLQLALVGGGSVVTPTLRLPLPAISYGVAGVDRLRTDALAAALTAGFDAAAFDLDVICFGPVNGPSYNFSGLANIGSRGVWLRDSFLEPGNLVHELGHNYGLNHANGWDTAGGPPIGAGREVEYADVSDSMSRSTGANRHFNAQKKVQLGWLTPAELLRPEASGVYRVYAHDVTHTAPGPRAIVVARNGMTNYWLELRQRLVEVPGWTNTLAIRWAEDNARPTLLLDTTPGSAGAFRDAALRPGWTFSDRAAGVHFRHRGFFPATATEPASLDVEIQKGAFPGNQGPLASLAAVPETAPVGVRLNFAVTATDADGDVLSYAWDWGDGTFGPDQAGVSKAYAVAGDYLIRCLVSDGKGGSAVVQTAVQVGGASTARIEGWIRRNDGTGVPGWWVTLGANRSTLTDAMGRYLFTGVAAGGQVVRPVVDGGVMTPESRTVTVAGGGTISVADFTVYDLSALGVVTLVPKRGLWHFLDDGSNAGTNWLSAGFNDAAWSRGPGPLGYGYPDLGTVVRHGPNPNGRWITTYFRRVFMVENPADYLGTRLILQRDDAALVLINGREVGRRNLPEGPVGFLTLPQSEILPGESTLDEELLLNGSGFVAGANVVTAEIHQWRPTDTDLRFELELQGLTRFGVVVPVQLLAQPAPLSLTPGQAGSFRVEAIGTQPMEFQWYRNGVAVIGATQSLLSLESAQAADAGEYVCTVKNVAGMVTSEAGSLSILSGPGLVLQPVDRVINENESTTFSVEAVGAAPLRYQWLKNNAPIVGATNSSFAVTNAKATDAASYRVVVQNGQGTATSNPANLVVVERPRWVQGPASMSVLAGVGFSLGVVATGTAPLTYQWLQAGAEIPGATDATLTVSGLPAVPSEVEYAVRIGNAAGVITSPPATITVNYGPVVVAAPSNVVVVVGQPAAFEIQANGTAPLTYRWWHDEVLLAGVIGPRLELPATTIRDSGTYRVVVGGPAGLVTNMATLNLWSPPVIVTEPVGLSRLAGDTAQISVTVAGDPTPGLQWYHDEQAVPGATGSILRFEPLKSSDAGQYWVRAINAAGMAESARIAVVVLDPGNELAPVIVVGPTSLALTEGAVAVLESLATGLPTPTYQWWKDGFEMPGATRQNLEVGPADSGTAGTYWVVASNRKGSVQSAPATVLVGARPRMVLHPQGADLVAGVNRTLTALVSSVPPKFFQWWKDGAPLTGATNTDLRLRAVGESDTGNYFVVVSNVYGNTASAPAVVRVFVKPTITRQPVGGAVVAGGAVQLGVEVAGTAPLNFSWMRNGIPVAGANGASLVLPMVTPALAGNYTVTVGNFAGSVTSTAAAVAVATPVVIQSPPVGTNSIAGRPLTLTVLAAGDGPLAYQWRRDGVDLPGATQADLKFLMLTELDAGSYTVRVTNSVSFEETTPVMISVALPPFIVVGPGSRVVPTGADVHWEVVAAGTEPRTYRWLKGGGNADGSPNAPVWLRAGVPRGASGEYQVVVENGAGSAVSDPFQLTVLDPPKITSPPVGQIVWPGTAVTLAVEASGDELHYQWRRSGLNLDGATQPMLRIGAVQVSELGDYSVVIFNRVGTVTTDPVRLQFLESVAKAVFTGVVTSESGLELRVSGSPGRVYRLESSTDLDHWVDEGSFRVGDDGQGVRPVTIPATAVRGYFRALSP